MNAAQISLKSMRVIHLCFLFTIILYLWVPSILALHFFIKGEIAIVGAMGLVSLTSIGAVLFFQAQRVRPAAERLKANPDDKQAALQWQAGLILCFVFSETVVLFGLASRILGAPWTIAGIFYLVGALMLLMCTPKLGLLPE